MPVLAYSGSEGWIVLNIMQKDLTEVKSSTDESDIETRYKVYSTINSEVEALREAAIIEIDTALFDSIYEVWKQKEQEKRRKKLTKEEKKKVEKNPKLPNISILHTGGTIASKVDYRTGGVISKFIQMCSRFPVPLCGHSRR